MEENPSQPNNLKSGEGEDSPLRENPDSQNSPSEILPASPFTEQYFVGAKPLPSQVLAAYGTQGPTPGKTFDSSAPIMADAVRTVGPFSPQARRPRQRRVLLPLVLFIATCYTTYSMNGPFYAAAVMFILTAHEFGHFFQTVRYKIHASFPMFIPMPIRPLGTMGAVIGMAPHEGDRKALFDVAVSGPIAGLIPTLICCYWGLQLSSVVPIQPGLDYYGEPLLFKWFIHWTFGPIPAGYDVMLHPIAFAGWVGLLITALNLFPIGQLDGGHTLYALLGKKAHVVARMIWIGCLIYVVLSKNWGWSLMLALVWMMGTAHPPTADDTVPLGIGRKILGWALLLFLPFGFTPTPFLSPQMEIRQQQPQQGQPQPGGRIVQKSLETEPDVVGRQAAQLSIADHNLSDHRSH